MEAPTFAAAGNLPNSRYILPTFEERTAYGYKRQDPYAKLFEDRIIFLGVQVDDASADDVMAQLLVLESQDPDRDIVTVGIGMAASMGQFLLSSGTKGKRYITPNARVLLHQPHGGFGGTSSDIQTQAALILDMKKRLAEITAAQTGKSVEQVNADGDRDRWFNAQEALEYGFVDHIRETALDVAEVTAGGSKK